MKQHTKIARIVLPLLFLAPVALSQQGRVYRQGSNWAEEVSGSIAAAKNLRIKTEFGTVRIQGGSQSGIGYVFRNTSYTSSEDKARRQFESYKVSAYVRGDTAYIVAEDQEGASHNKCSGEFVINVPRAIELVKLETGGGDVATTGIAGRLEAETGGGNINIDDVGGSVATTTGGGNIEIGSVNGDVSLETGGGKIVVHSVKGKINATTGGGPIVILSGSQGAVLEASGGNIEIKQCTGKVKVSTGGGNVDLGDLTGPVEIETGGGSIRLASAKSWVRAETGAGRIELNGVTSARAETGAGGILAKFIASSGDKSDSVLETSVGDITVYIASDVAITVRASIEVANGHTIESDIPGIHVNQEGGEWGPKTFTAEGSLNGGGPMLKVRTTTGNIRILRASR